jgi:DNA helicase-2/ATP-dependent DNA helicase PcrA
MEEERRLCYVAITRAKQQLYLSHAKQRMLYGRTTFNRASRFLAEIPEDCLVARKKGNTASGSRETGRTGSYGTTRTTRTPMPKPASAAPMLELSKGDQVIHTAFGEGMVLSILKMNGDALVEIAFDQVGTKKLMLKTASAHMKKK